MSNLTYLLIVAGRVLLGGYFLQAAIRNFGKADMHTQILAGRGVPQAQLVLYAGLLVQGVSGAMIVAGLWPGLGALGLIVFMIAAAWLYHNFWDYQGEEQITHLNACLSNAALIGAMLLVIAIG